MAPWAKRLAKAKQVARNRRIVVSDLERILGTRYTFATARALKRRLPWLSLVWLMGADNLAEFHLWRRWEALATSLAIAIYDRPTYFRKAMASPAAKRLARFRRGRESEGCLAALRPPAWAYLVGRVHPGSATRVRQSSGWAGDNSL